MEYYDLTKDFTAYSALFKLTPESTFIRDALSNKVVVLSNDENDINLKINNEKRLITNVYGDIREMYNNRISSHNLKLLIKLNL